MAKKQSTVEWKDTNNKPYYVTYSFPIMLTNRCWFFWASTNKQWKKVLNLANSLAFSCHISVVFLYGEIKEQTLKNYIEKLNNTQLIILHTDCISTEEFICLESAIEYVKGAKSWGGGVKDKDGEYIFDINAKDSTFLDPVQKELYQNFLRAKSLIEKIAERVKVKGFTLKSIGIPQRHISGEQENLINDLLKIVREIYPCGVECDTTEERAYKRVGVPKLIKLGLKGETEDELVKNMGISVQKQRGLIQLSIFNSYSVSAMEIVSFIRSMCDKDFKEKGRINQTKLAVALANPPYGVYECNYYYYLLAYAYSVYMEQGYYYGSLFTSCPIEDIELNRTNIVAPPLFVMSDKQRSLNRKLVQLFDIQLENKKEINSTIQIIHKAIRWITENIHYDTVARISLELWELLRYDCDYYSFETERFDDWLTEEKLKELYVKLRTIDNDFFVRFTEKYGTEKVQLYKKSHFVKGGAIGWAWETETVDEQVENFMKEIYCRECGKKISLVTNEDAEVYDSMIYENGKMESRSWTLKEIIGINKKLLGRQQNEFLCIECMAEAFECSEFDLWEKMHQFKEEGCTLFS